MTHSSDKTLVHATAVALDGAALLLRGGPGSGKSDLALRLIDQGAMLIADDQAELVREGDILLASAPATIEGQLEVRGLGLATLPVARRVPVRLLVDLVPAELVERLPAPETEILLGLPLPLLMVAPFEASAPAKLRLAMAALGGRVTLDRG